MDLAIGRIYALALSRTREEGRGDLDKRGALSIIATGGYGRKELSPFSDIDVAFVPLEEEDPFVDILIRNAFRLMVEVLIDGCGLDLSYAFRPIADCPQFDYRTRTSLLDARHIAGSMRPFRKLISELYKSINPILFVQDIISSREISTRRFDGLYSLEPNIRDGRGGLRDFQRAIWISKVVLGARDGDPMKRAVERGVIPEKVADSARSSYENLLGLRNWLHMRSGRRSDVLIVNLQEEAGRALLGAGYLEFMEKVFSWMEWIERAYDGICEAVSEMRLDAGDGISVFRGVMDPSGKGIGPRTLSKAFSLSKRYGFSIGPSLKKALVRVGRKNRDVVISTISDLLRDGCRVSEMLREMLSIGLLDLVIPGISRAMKLVPSDPAHRFTVGEHSLKVVECIESIEPSDDSPLQEAKMRVRDNDVLFLSALLHDFGKIVAEGSSTLFDHAEIGASIAYKVALDLGLGEEKARKVEKLVRLHLLLPRHSRLRDLSLPETIRDVVDLVGDEELLDMLYILSYADTISVGGGYTVMEMGLMEELYLKARSSIREDLEEGMGRGAERAKEKARRGLASDSRMSDGRAFELLELLPPAYFLNTPMELVSLHMEMLSKLLSSEGPLIEVVEREGMSEIVICAFDDPVPGLLSKITGTLYAGDVDIYTVYAYTLNSDFGRIALDSIWASYKGRALSGYKARKAVDALEDVLRGRRSVEDIIAESGKAMPSFKVEDVNITNSVADDMTYIHIVAQDVRGLFYSLTKALSSMGLDIRTAKAITWAGKAEDAFYVVSQKGGKIPQEEFREIKRRIFRIGSEDIGR
jgi:[protein-PII] uridylyltransferase